ncbi:MAG: hypothetical protein QNJ98_17485 [Planctomycetota bacterium]|nr:hypothetical protein [Planctomycetota bacterium]
MAILTALAKPRAALSISRILPDVVLASQYYAVPAEEDASSIAECHVDAEHRVVVTPDCGVSAICRELAALLAVQSDRASLDLAPLQLSSDGLWTWAATLDLIRGGMLVTLLERSVPTSFTFRVEDLHGSLKSAIEAPDLRWMTPLMAEALEAPPVAPAPVFEAGAEELLGLGLLERTDDGQLRPLETLVGMAADLMTPLPAVVTQVRGGRATPAWERTLTLRGRSLWQIRRAPSGDRSTPYELASIDGTQAIQSWVECLCGSAAPSSHEAAAERGATPDSLLQPSASKAPPESAAVAKPQRKPSRPARKRRAKTGRRRSRGFPFLIATLVLLVVITVLLIAYAKDVPLDRGANGSGTSAGRPQAVLNLLLREFERQHAMRLSTDQIGYERMEEQAQRAADRNAQGESYDVNLPFITVDDNGDPIHFRFQVRPDMR